MTTNGSPILDLTHTDADTADYLAGYFAAKTAQDAEATREYFSPDALTYSDAPLGWVMVGAETIAQAFAAAMPQWGEGTSYPTAILGSRNGGDGSALVAFTNTPGIVGNELLHILAAVDFRAGKIIRWVDYWDSSSIDQGFRDMVRTPADSFPLTFSENEVVPIPLGAIGDASTSLQEALAAGDAAQAAALFDFDASWEDQSLRVKVIGRPAIERYLDRSLALSPYGPQSRLRHVVGHENAGAFEWIAAPATHVLSGITALTLTTDGLVARATTVYDGKLLAPDTRTTLITLATAP